MKAVVVITDRDNVATALETLEPGRTLDVECGAIVVGERVPSGHKVALRQIEPGEAILKYGNPIGTATARIPAGHHVHVHNVASTRGRGDVR